MYDRAMQALYALALDPVSETTAGANSFGFLMGRCAQDATVRSGGKSALTAVLSREQ